ncbi:MAG: hypothetical protein GY816_23445, partial [Cytophagales bacterium]|nr:hypothetical protein [Cytophagales bacterium]
MALNSPKMEIEGDEVAQASETGLEVLVRLVKALCSEPRGLCSQSLILWAILDSLAAKLRATYVAPLNKEEEEVFDEIHGLIAKNNKVGDELPDYVGNTPDENTQEHEMEFHKLLQEVSKFMEVHGVTAPKMNIEGVRENSVNSSHS